MTKKEQTEDRKKDKGNILYHLRTRSCVHLEPLARRCRIQERYTKRLIQELREDGYAIGYSSDGYFLATSGLELQHTIARLQKEIRTRTKTIHSLRNAKEWGES